MDASLFHFLRPWWLLLLLPALLLLAFRPARERLRSAWRKAIDPHLLPYVTDAGRRTPQNFFDRWSLTFFLSLLSIALAGPTFEKLPEQSRFAKTPLVVLIELSPAMLAQDLSPSRLRLAQLKLRELVKQRDLGDATLIAFAGDAHVVVPSTRDINTLLSLSDSLSPNLMPIPGANLIKALGLAVQTGIDEAKKIVVISSSQLENSAAEITSFAKKNSLELLFWIFATAQGAPLPKADGSFANDQNGNVILSTRQDAFLGELKRSPNVSLVMASLDGSDVEAIKSELQGEVQGAPSKGHSYEQWYDLGPYVLALACLLFLVGFFMAKQQWWLFGLVFLLKSDPSEALRFKDWFLRDDQKAYEALKEGKSKEAAELYPDDFGKGTAYFKAGQYDEAIAHLKKVDSPEGLYNLGNAYAHKSMLKEAIAAYDGALKKDPNHADAKHNKEILEKLLQEQEKQQEQKSDQEKPEEKKQENQENKGQGTNSEEQKSGSPAKEEAKKPEAQEEQKPDANTLYYFDKLEKNNNQYLKRKFLYESRQNQGVK